MQLLAIAKSEDSTLSEIEDVEDSD